MPSAFPVRSSGSAPRSLGRDGGAVAIRRRKGRKNTLQGEDGAVLPDDALEPFLGAVGEDAFRRSFGLDAAALREGGEAMLSANGDVGASLMEAASGLRNLLDLRETLDAEADAIFSDRRAERRLFYQALDRHSAARKAIETKELRVDAWRRLDADIAALGPKTGIRPRRAPVERDRAGRASRGSGARPRS